VEGKLLKLTMFAQDYHSDELAVADGQFSQLHLSATNVRAHREYHPGAMMSFRSNTDLMFPTSCLIGVSG